jgi:hypothetical protein
MQPSKSVSSERTLAPFASGWTSRASEIVSDGRKTTAGIPACAA